MFSRHFATDEFKARRERLCAAMGEESAALLQGAPGPVGSDVFSQYKDFHYLSGFEGPRAYLTVDGRTACTTLFLPHESQVEKQSTEPAPCAENAEYVQLQTGVDRVLAVEQLGSFLNQARTIYTPFEDGEMRTVNRHDARSWAVQQAADPWDTRLTRAAQFIATVSRQFPQIECRNLSPLTSELRLIKSPAEIAMLRRAGELTGRAVTEAMRTTRPGVMEYQLDAVMCYHFLAGGAAGRAYAAICASGDNIFYAHYSDNGAAMADGDLVLVDCAPDYAEYVSDIGRMWPVNGTYNPTQRAIYGYIVEYHKALLEAVRPGKTAAEIKEETEARMSPVLAKWPFASEAHREAAGKIFGQISHGVGLTVHDGGLHYTRPLAPGMVFSLDPSFRLPEEKLYLRVEDTIVVTEDGIENLTAGAPLDLDDVERVIRQGGGILQQFPPA